MEKQQKSEKQRGQQVDSSMDADVVEISDSDDEIQKKSSIICLFFIVIFTKCTKRNVYCWSI